MVTGTLDVDLLEGKKVKKRMSDGVLPNIKIEFQSLSGVRDLRIQVSCQVCGMAVTFCWRIVLV